MSLTIYGKNPITLEKINVNEWLSESNDNILLIFDKNTNLNFSNSVSRTNNEIIFCLKRSFIQTPTLNNIYIKCIIENDVLIPDKTNKSKETFFNLGYYLNKNLLIQLKSLGKSLINKNNIFKIKFADANYYDFINKEALELSIIGLAKKPKLIIPKNIPKNMQNDLKLSHKLLSLNETKITNKNIPYKKDVYFEKIISDALINYSFQWDAPINLYLRQGESYFETSVFKQYFRRYGPTLPESIQNIKQKIEDLDKAFNEAATINQNSDTIYFRGMQRPFNNLNKIGDSELIPNFISVTSSMNVAWQFSGMPKGFTCCLYYLKLAKGVPYIDMINTTKFKREKELLLPRNLIFKLIDILYTTNSYGQRIPIAVLYVDLKYKDQFRIVNNCKKFIVGEIVPYSPSYISQNNIKKLINKKFPLAKDENNKPINIEANVQNHNIQDEVQNHCVPLVGKKCPKGYRINKITGMCEFYDPKLEKIKTQKIKKEKREKKEKKEKSKSQKKKRCPNGTYKNKITGNCEKKK